MDIKKGDIVADPKGQSGTVMGVSFAGRATVRLESGVVIALDVKELKKIPPKHPS
jgi:hypothetical protein